MNMHMFRAATPVAAFFLACLFALLPAGLQASAVVGIDPVSIKLPAKALAGSVNIKNRGTKPAAFQAEIFEWRQEANKDVLTPTRKLLLSPPIFRIAPNQTQVVRVGRLKAEAAPAVEITYRLILSELPPEGEIRQNMIGTVLKLNLPVFVPAAQRQPANLFWKVRHGSNDDLLLTVQNSGNSTERLARLDLNQGGVAVATRAASEYILPGASRELVWKDALRQAKPGLPLSISTALSNHKVFSQSLDLGVVSVVPAN